MPPTVTTMLWKTKPGMSKLPSHKSNCLTAHRLSAAPCSSGVKVSPCAGTKSRAFKWAAALLGSYLSTLVGSFVHLVGTKVIKSTGTPLHACTQFRYDHLSSKSNAT